MLFLIMPGPEWTLVSRRRLARLAEIVPLECAALGNRLFRCVFIVTIPAAVFAINRVVRMMILDQLSDVIT